ncbi:MAG: hypothetical protein H0X16_07440 [Chloroflexi bacterium]|nr:hypothetical protein [Chloroflexota bacterium]
MIVVLGRPNVRQDGPHLRPAGLAVEIALAAAAEGARVEVVGSVGDDVGGDAVAVALGRAGIGHAALLRDAAAVTPGMATDIATGAGRLPGLEPGDVELGLRYLSDFSVIVLAEALSEEAQAVVLEAAAYQGAAVVAANDPEASGKTSELERGVVVPRETDDDEASFARRAGQLAVRLERESQS